ncbi:MAG TPA: GNAT family N-acetyltransferase [Bacteroidales bacterium]|nr:GNAT family N-acetyltransferase [Bacteroidales bacterium]
MQDDQIREIIDRNDQAWGDIESLFADMYAYMQSKGLMAGLAEDGAKHWVESVSKGLGRFGIMYISMHGKDVTGFAYGSIRLMPDYLGSRKTGVITHIHLKENYRRKGTGALLVRALEKWFLAKEVHSIELQVIIDNSSAMAFWEKLGYKTELIQYRKITGKA